MQQEVHHQIHHHHGLDPTHQRQRTVSSNQEIPVPLSEGSFGTIQIILDILAGNLTDFELFWK